MKYYIFGGNGFVGQYLANELVRLQKDVVICDVGNSLNKHINDSCEYIKMNLCNIQSIRNIPILHSDILINLAANQYHTKVPKNREKYFFSVNTEGTANLLMVALEKECRDYLMLTTDMTYGKPLYLPVDVEHPQNPFGPYGQSKKAAEQICFQYRERGMNITILRPRMIMGPGRLGVLLKLFKLIDLNFPVPTIGNGKNHYQMISVFDCVSAILCALNKGLPNKEYNLGSKNPPTINLLLKELIKSANSSSILIPTSGRIIKILLTFFDLIGLPVMYKEQFMIADEEYILDISKTEEDLDWHPKYSDSDMIKFAYEWYKKR